VSDTLYEANPSMFRMYPFGVVLAVVLFPVGVFFLLYWYLQTKADHLIIRADELVWTRGLINKQYTEVNMSAIRTVRVNQSLLQRMLNAGDITIFTAGDEPELVINGMPNPEEIREHIKGQVVTQE